MFDASGFFPSFLFIILGSKSNVFEPGSIDKRTCEDKQETGAEARGCVPSPSDFRCQFFLLKPASMSEIFTGTLGQWDGAIPITGSSVRYCSLSFFPLCGVSEPFSEACL